MRRLGTMLALFALVGCATHACPDAIAAPARTPRFVVVRSDYASSSALALLDEAGEVIDGDWVDSGTCVSTLTTGLAGDLVVPQTALGGGAIAWMNRVPVDTLSVWTPASLTTIDARAEGDRATGFSANPYDALSLPDGRVLLARFGAAQDPSASALQHGNDVAVIEHGVITSAIALGADTTCTTSPSTEAFARPAALRVLEHSAARVVVVALARLSGDYQCAGEGAVGVIDAATLTARAPVVLPGMANCTELSTPPDDPSRVLVLCQGPRNADDPTRRATTGVVELTLAADGTLAETARYVPGASGPIPSTGVIALAGRGALFVHTTRDASASEPAHDALVWLSLPSGSGNTLFTTRTPFVLQRGTLAGGVALVPDMETFSIHRVVVSGDTPTDGDPVSLRDGVALPPVQIAPL